jgi:hypothetical protein
VASPTPRQINLLSAEVYALKAEVARLAVAVPPVVPDLVWTIPFPEVRRDSAGIVYEEEPTDSCSFLQGFLVVVVLIVCSVGLAALIPSLFELLSWAVRRAAVIM